MYVWNIPKSYSCELWVYHKSLCAQCESGNTAVFWTLRYFFAPLLFPHPFFTLLPKHPGSDVRGKLSQIRSHLTLKMEQNCQLGIQGRKAIYFLFFNPICFFGLVIHFCLILFLFLSYFSCFAFFSLFLPFSLFCLSSKVKKYILYRSKIIFPHQGCIHFINPIQ